MDKLKALMARCKCGVYLTVNEHRDYYYTAYQALDEAKGYECPPEIAPDVVARMIETNTIVRLHFYPDTPIGSYEIWHYDLDAALDEALACLTPNVEVTGATQLHRAASPGTMGSPPGGRGKDRNASRGQNQKPDDAAWMARRNDS